MAEGAEQVIDDDGVTGGERAGRGHRTVGDVEAVTTRVRALKTEDGAGQGTWFTGAVLADGRRPWHRLQGAGEPMTMSRR